MKVKLIKSEKLHGEISNFESVINSFIKNKNIIDIKYDIIFVYYGGKYLLMH